SGSALQVYGATAYAHALRNFNSSDPLSVSEVLTDRAIRKRPLIASMTASSGPAGCSTTILVLAEPAPKSSRRRGRSSSSVGLHSTALPKTARRLCASLTAHATCRQLNARRCHG